ncbi:3-phosphoglycerate dehydrogenase family protein [Gammaproteobacteria bacterium]|jgi:D-3-phosphoglycerate dehydrogenase|nr:3-phosphoglycerate dehydrogenase family protein [Gammaproteobacteria bacterium]MDA7747439.1 3-phosphoglycerate dehydrogenase family protein [Gammaproteobacteria bacterium]MDA7829944.1 3-phosphoglycerate dehydrogenase family protein [Gammaproteobacteria bacterium]MDA7844781.1 3-phosphoglycerate dehydrogenase family protein [Gammaproteobacteria bacterium]MDA9102109.1 3-phosphoglycerate dehydrogenase family protein [Gammaproteobacteria bacterium]|tara:strand:- start:220 stop:1395 length:1176 start_codon:yes stop_codon:yes gene_type:complete
MYTYKIFNNIAEDGINILQNNELRVDEINPDALLIRSQVLKDEDLGNSLKCIGRAGAGTNNVPVQDATGKGIVVFNTPGANANAVKELVVCGMLLSSRGIIEGNAYSKTLSGQEASELNKSMEAQKKIFKGSELKGKTLGIVGLGAIGSLLAQTAEVMGMKIIGYDPHISVDAAWRLPQDVEKAETLEFLLANSDYISLHVPLIDATKDLISKKSLRYFKKGAKLINLSRGGIVNNADIIDALNSKQISTFVTDFPTPELVDRSSDFNDVILLPHLGASTKEAEVNCAVMAANQVANFLKNGVIINSVNFPSIKLGRATENRLVIINKNEPGMIGKIADQIASSNLNITDMTNKSRETIAINLIDLEDKPSEQLIDDIRNIEHVLSVRLCV